MKDKLESIIHNNKQILIALDALQFKGYDQCKTFTNIVEALEMNTGLIQEVLDGLNTKKDKLKEDKEEE